MNSRPADQGPRCGWPGYSIPALRLRSNGPVLSAAPPHLSVAGVGSNPLRILCQGLPPWRARYPSVLCLRHVQVPSGSPRRSPSCSKGGVTAHPALPRPRWRGGGAYSAAIVGRGAAPVMASAECPTAINRSRCPLGRNWNPVIRIPRKGLPPPCGGGRLSLSFLGRYRGRGAGFPRRRSMCASTAPPVRGLPIRRHMLIGAYYGLGQRSVRPSLRSPPACQHWDQEGGGTRHRPWSQIYLSQRRSIASFREPGGSPDRRRPRPPAHRRVIRRRRPGEPPGGAPLLRLLPRRGAPCNPGPSGNRDHGVTMPPFPPKRNRGMAATARRS